MKRKLAWLALPLALCALVFGVTWRENHPTPTKEDFEVRALLFKSSKLAFNYAPNSSKEYVSKISGEEFKPFINSLFLKNREFQPDDFLLPTTKGRINISCVNDKAAKGHQSGFTVFIIPSPKRGGIGGISVINGMEHHEKELHSVTVERWMELLLSNPRIGPELRARTKS